MSEASLDELIAAIDIVEYIGQFVDLEQRGDEFWGLSCFKDEKTPSFSVRREPPVFFDYSSGIGGNVFTFTKFYYHCSAGEAVQKLSDYAGFSDNQAGDIKRAPRLSATQVFKRYQKPIHTQKPSSAKVLPPDYMLRYENRPEKLQVWRDEGISDVVMAKFQVRYDPFSDRIVYPIRNLEGDIVNVGGRTLDPLWKEKDLKKYCYFHSWGTLDVIYGAFENMQGIMARREIILFEGCKSVLIAASFGVTNTGALLTSHLNPNQLRLLARLGCDVVFALDNDVDVRRDHNIQKLQHYVRVTRIHDTSGLLDEKDSPVDKGEEVFRKLYADRIAI